MMHSQKSHVNPLPYGVLAIKDTWNASTYATAWRLSQVFICVYKGTGMDRVSSESWIPTFRKLPAPALPGEAALGTHQEMSRHPYRPEHCPDSLAIEKGCRFELYLVHLLLRQ